MYIHIFNLIVYKKKYVNIFKKSYICLLMIGTIINNTRIDRLQRLSFKNYKFRKKKKK